MLGPDPEKTDEAAIRLVIDRWLAASAAGEIDAVLDLMTDDVVFLTPGRAPFGKAEFAESSRRMAGTVRFEGRGDIEEIAISGALAVVRNRLAVTMTPKSPGAQPRCLAGHTLTVFRKEPDGRWLLARDANLLAPVPSPGI